jgi:signal transduction histidine kinase
MHELRTPLNAIIGFGEIIEGQYLGPAHRAIVTARPPSLRRQGALPKPSTIWTCRQDRSGALEGKHD